MFKKADNIYGNKEEKMEDDDEVVGNVELAYHNSISFSI